MSISEILKKGVNRHHLDKKDKLNVHPVHLHIVYGMYVYIIHVPQH